MKDNNIKKLQDEHARLVTEARSLLDSQTDLTKENEERFDKLMADADSIEARVKREQRAVEAEKNMIGKIHQAAEQRGISREQAEGEEVSYRDSFSAWAKYGMTGINDSQRSVLMQRQVNGDEYRAQSVSGGSPVGIYGGYTVPPEMVMNIEQAMKDYSGVLQAADIFDTGSGVDLPWPNTNDTSNKGAILGENQPVDEQDVTFSQTTFKSFLYYSKLIRCSYQLLQDSAFNLESFITNIAAERIGRKLNEDFSTGAGTTTPLGVVNGATLGYTGLTQNSITYDALVNLEHSVDPAYRISAKTAWMFNDATLKVLRLMKDSTGRPLIWNQDGNLGQGITPSLFGRPYFINQDMASIAAASKSVLFGDFSKYKVRRVRDYVMVRLNERYADRLQVGWFMYARFDGRLIDAGTNPLKYLQQAAASP